MLKLRLENWGKRGSYGRIGKIDADSWLLGTWQKWRLVLRPNVFLPVASLINFPSLFTLSIISFKDYPSAVALLEPLLPSSDPQLLSLISRLHLQAGSLSTSSHLISLSTSKAQEKIPQLENCLKSAASEQEALNFRTEILGLKNLMVTDHALLLVATGKFDEARRVLKEFRGENREIVNENGDQTSLLNNLAIATFYGGRLEEVSLRWSDYSRQQSKYKTKAEWKWEKLLIPFTPFVPSWSSSQPLEILEGLLKESPSQVTSTESLIFNLTTFHELRREEWVSKRHHLFASFRESTHFKKREHFWLTWSSFHPLKFSSQSLFSSVTDKIRILTLVAQWSGEGNSSSCLKLAWGDISIIFDLPQASTTVTFRLRVFVFRVWLQVARGTGKFFRFSIGWEPWLEIGKFTFLREKRQMHYDPNHWPWDKCKTEPVMMLEEPESAKNT